MFSWWWKNAGGLQDGAAYRCVCVKAGGILVCADEMSLMQGRLSKILMYYVSGISSGWWWVWAIRGWQWIPGYVDGRCVTTAMKYSMDKDMFAILRQMEIHHYQYLTNRTYKLVFERRNRGSSRYVKVSVDGKEVWAKNKYDKENRKSNVTVNASTAAK